jgi:hypothetical protein
MVPSAKSLVCCLAFPPGLLRQQLWTGSHSLAYWVRRGHAQACVLDVIPAPLMFLGRARLPVLSMLLFQRFPKTPLTHIRCIFSAQCATEHLFGSCVSFASVSVALA